MDMNDWLLGNLVRQRLDEIRTQTRWVTLAARSAPQGQPLRTALGLALTHIGRAIGRPRPDSAESGGVASGSIRDGGC
jgi:hypothetical protein